MENTNRLDTYDHQYKIVMVGDSGVGKTALLTQITKGIFKDQEQTTIVCDFQYKKINYEGKILKC